MRHAYLFCQAGARVLFAFHWSQALSEGGSVPKEIRDQMFKPGMNHWGYGWFVTKMAPGEPGAGTTLEEMCGDMPGNYFSWILRYPERNVYGSTERLEQNIQAILCDMEPKMPRRSAKDLAAQAWLVPEAWAESHRMQSALVGLFAVAVIRQAARRRRRTGIPNQA